jgi:SOS-response transcriptional repressor LexA
MGSGSTVRPKTSWSRKIADLREQLHLSQTEFGQMLHSSSMAVSRWERGVQEPPSGIYIELGNIAGNPDCWYFWGRAGLRSEDLMRVMPGLQRRLRSLTAGVEIVTAGSGLKKTPKSAKQSALVALPLLNVFAATHGEEGDVGAILQAAPVERIIAAPKDWCPNPAQTSCLRVQGHSMMPLIHDGYVIAVDTSQRDHTKLDGKIVIAWNKDKGLTISRFRRYDHTEVLQSENPEYESTTLSKVNNWKILAKVLWWIGRAP